jgi:hypothetical protein
MGLPNFIGGWALLTSIIGWFHITQLPCISMCAVYLWKQQDVSNHARIQECLSQVEAEATRCHRAQFLLILVVKNSVEELGFSLVSWFCITLCTSVTPFFSRNVLSLRSCFQRLFLGWITSLLYELSSLSRHSHMLAKHAMVSSTQGC